MKLHKLGLAASAVVVMALAGLHNVRAQGFDDEGGRDRSWATKGQAADAPAPKDASTAADSKAGNTATRSWNGGSSADPEYNRRSHSLTRATPGTGVKTPPWVSPADAKTAANEGTVVNTDKGWAHQGTWKGPSAEAADHSADMKMDSGNGTVNTAPAPASQPDSAPAASDGPAPSMASPSE